MGTAQGSLFSGGAGLAAASPFGAAASAAAAIAATPNTSATGEISQRFAFEGVNFGGRGVPWYVLAIPAVLVGLYLLRRGRI
jgi:hypothetical protein